VTRLARLRRQPGESPFQLAHWAACGMPAPLLFKEVAFYLDVVAVCLCTERSLCLFLQWSHSGYWKLLQFTPTFVRWTGGN